MKPWKEGVDKIGAKIIGKTLVFLDDESCRYQECLLGNMIADSMVYAASYTLLLVKFF